MLSPLATQPRRALPLAVSMLSPLLLIALLPHTVAPPAQRQATIEIAPGVFMPLINLGRGNHSAWLRVGGRGVDTAYDYGDGHQREIGAAIRRSGIPRSEIFVTTKVPCCESASLDPSTHGWRPPRCLASALSFWVHPVEAPAPPSQALRSTGAAHTGWALAGRMWRARAGRMHVRWRRPT